MRKQEFTERQHAEIYEFLEQYVQPDKKVEARKVLLSMFRHDRVVVKQRLNKSWENFLKSVNKAIDFDW